MSQQMTDPFVWDGKEYVFLGADDVYSLFDPEAFGLKPTWPITSCMKGFIVHFELKNDRLSISKLEVNCKDDKYPPINNVAAHADEADLFHVYDNLELQLNYTGIIVIGTSLLNRYIGRAFTGSHSYMQTFDLHFTDGVLISCEESTGNYEGI